MDIFYSLLVDMTDIIEHGGDDILQRKLVEADSKSEAQEISNRNNETLNDLETQFQRF